MLSEVNHYNAQFEKIEYTGESSESSSCDLTKLVYKLDWALRDAIICNINGYTQLLFANQLDNAAEVRLAKTNTDLYQQLVSLPLKSDDEISHSGEVVLELALGVRCEIVNALITNQSLGKADFKKSEEPRMKMIEKNNSLVSTLMKLPVSVNHGTAEETDSQTLKDELNGLTEVLDLADQFMNQTNENNRLRVDEQAGRISAGAELNKLKRKGDKRALARLTDGEAKIDLKRAGAEFECSFDDMATFLNSGEKRKRQVAIFKDLTCSIEISMFKKTPEFSWEQKDYLSVFVRVENFSGSLLREGYCSVTLLNRLSKSDSENPFFDSYLNFSGNSICWGKEDLTTMKELRCNNFIEKDQIKFRVFIGMPLNFRQKCQNYLIMSAAASILVFMVVLTIFLLSKIF